MKSLLQPLMRLLLAILLYAIVALSGLAHALLQGGLCMPLRMLNERCVGRLASMHARDVE